MMMMPTTSCKAACKSSAQRLLQEGENEQHYMSIYTFVFIYYMMKMRSYHARYYSGTSGYATLAKQEC